LIKAGINGCKTGAKGAADMRASDTSGDRLDGSTIEQ